MSSNIRVLASPASYFISDQTGSDPGIAYGLLSSLGSFPLSICAVANRSDIHKRLPSSVKIFRTGVNFNGSGLEQILFYVRSYYLGRKLASSFSPQVIHQMSGISYGSSFNPLILFGNVPEVPFVLGPAVHNVPIPPEVVEETRGVRWGRSWTDFRSPFEMSVQKFYEKALAATKVARRFLFEETLDRASIIVTVNEFTKEAFSKVVDSRKIVVLPIGVDPQEYAYSPMKQNYKILAIGQLFIRKGFAYAIRAMPLVLRHFPETQLHIAGNGPQYGNLVALAQRLDVRDHVYFHGFVERRKLPSLFASCRVTCLPVLEEGFGMAALEAMSVGRPVISTNAVGPREIIRHGKTGLVVPIADANALAEAAIELLGDFELSKKMGIEARKLVEEMYDWKVIAEQYYDIYTRLSS